jgi:hypothetical protein
MAATQIERITGLPTRKTTNHNVKKQITITKTANTTWLGFKVLKSRKYRICTFFSYSAFNVAQGL